jgi:uncharacterized protein with GYD domain
MPRYLSLFKYNAEGRKGLMKEKAAAREAALKLTVESAGGKLELIYWAAPGGEYSGINIGEFPDAGSLRCGCWIDRGNWHVFRN